MINKPLSISPDIVADLDNEVGELRQDVLRLRAALQEIVDLGDSEAGEPLDDAIRIARDALSPPKVTTLRDSLEFLQSQANKADK